MDQQNKKELRKYYKQIRALFPIYTALEKRFLTDLQEDISTFISEHAECAVPAIKEKFGEPQEIIQDYLETVDAEYLCKHIRRTKYIRIGVLCIVILIAAVCALKAGLYYKSYQDVQNTIVTKEVTIIE